MMMNGPRTRLTRTPGRRMISVVSFPKKATVRVMVLATATKNPPIEEQNLRQWSSLLLLLANCFPRLRPLLLIPAHQLGEHLVERCVVLGTADHLHPLAPDRVDETRSGGAGLLRNHQQPPRSALANLLDPWRIGYECPVYGAGGRYLYDVASQ